MKGFISTVQIFLIAMILLALLIVLTGKYEDFSKMLIETIQNINRGG